MALITSKHLGGTKWFCLGLGLAVTLMRGATTPPAYAQVPAPAPAQPASLPELAAARYHVATQGYEIATAGRGPSDAPGPDVLDWMRRRVRARLDMPEPKNDRVAFLKEYVELLKSEEAFQERMVKSRLSGTESLLRAQYDRLEGQMLLAQEEAK